MHGELKKHHTRTGGRTRRFIAFAVVLLAVAGALYWVYGTSPAPQQRGGRFGAPGGPVPVLAANASRADVPVYLDAVGTVRALNTVTVRPQVDGKLIAVAFKEGQDVKRGDVLARIDPATYQAAYDQALAKKAQDEALLTNAKNDLDRYEKLAASNAINRQQADTQRALVAQYTAQVQADQAAIESAQATLGYTTIRAPIDGRTGLRQVDEGNIVRASDTAGIVVLTQLKPIAVLFSLPQQDINTVNAAFAKGPLAADAMRSDTGEVIERGTLTVMDNQVDASTGTVRLKAEFPNGDLKLWPGQFVNVRLLVNTLNQVVVIPTGAVQRGPNGTFVYVVQEDGSAAMRAIQVQKQDETQTVVASGVTPPERVITTGFARLTDGAQVSIGSADGTPPAASPQGARPGGPRQGGEAGQRRGAGNPRSNPAQ
ncbi:MAG: efflux RND transporter periplasmic adaptor subunit [Pseudolabrys sp.]